MRQPIHPARSEGPLGPVLDELENVRLLAKRLALRRSFWMAPLGAATGLAVALLPLWEDYDPVLVFPVFVFLGGFGGYALAAAPAAHAYARLYKARVVPMLIGTSTELHYQRPPKGRLQPLRAIFQFDALRGDDALVGQHRGLPVVIAEVRALRRRALRSTVAFDGLVVEVALRNRLSGTTVILPAASAGPPHEGGTHRLERVDLEDPVFERAYAVYSSDQVTARVLLTPEFMERFRSLDTRGRFGQPFCLGQADGLFVALPTRRGSAIFTPPDFDASARSPDALAKLKEDLAAVLGVIDSIVDLDSRNAASLALPSAPNHARP